MSEADERLIVMLEARISEFEKRMIAAERRGTRTYTGLSRGAKSAARNMEADLVSATSRINAALATTASKVGVFGKSFIGGLAGGAVVSLLGSVNFQIAGTVRALAEVGDQAKRAGVSVQAFQELRYVAEQNRIPIDALTDGLKEMNLRLDEFIVTGTGPAAESLARLGYSAQELKAKLADPSALLLEMIGRMEGLDKAAQIRVADEVFGGTAGERFVELLSLGQDGIQGQIDRARELGLVIEEEQIAKAAELDAKFAEVGARITSVWQTAVVEAGYFFGLIDREREKLVLSQEEAARVVGEDMAAALAGQSEVGQDALEVIESLVTEYEDLAAEAQNIVPALADASNMMAGLGRATEAAKLAELAGDLAEAASAFEDGTITGDEFRAKLEEVATQAVDTIGQMDELDQVRLGGVTGAVQGLLAWIQELPGAAAAARSEIVALESLGMDTGTPLAADGNLLPPGEGSVTTSPRPRRAPPMLGETDTGSGGGKGGGGGGGKTSQRIEALLADLQTEREILDEWYQESLELLNGATDAQLEALGGRHEAMERLEEEHMERLREIRDEGQGGILADAETFFGEMASAFAAGGDRMAKAARIFGALEAAANVGRAQAQVLADPTLPWWRKIPAMLSIGAAGAKVVASIRGGGSGGGGGGASSGGGAAPGGGRAAEGPLRVLLEGIKDGERYEGAALRRMFDALAKEAGDRGLMFARSVG